jgi:hypothetical protein
MCRTGCRSTRPRSRERFCAFRRVRTSNRSPTSRRSLNFIPAKLNPPGGV